KRHRGRDPARARPFDLLGPGHRWRRLHRDEGGDAERALSTLTLGPSTMPDGVRGVAYDQAFSLPGGTGVVTFAVVDTGVPPVGLNLDHDTGHLTGVPTAVGTRRFTVQATDSAGCSDTLVVNLSINCPPVSVEPPVLASGTLNVAYHQPLSATGCVGTPQF